MVRISIFTGREARLNKAIFWILAKQGELTIYDIWQRLRKQRNFSYIRYHIVNRRVRVLEKQGYSEKSGERRTKTGFATALYQLTFRAYLAILLDQIDLDDFVEKAPEASILCVIGAIYQAVKSTS
jgi:DNA-binding PadR family transcriptional regulator